MIDLAVNIGVGFVLGIGIVIGGLSKRHKVIGFLTIRDGAWDPTILVFFLSTILFNHIVWHFMEKKKTFICSIS